MAAIGPINTPSALLAQSLQQAASRSGSTALRDFAAQMASRASGAQTSGTPAQQITSALDLPSPARATAGQPDTTEAVRRPGSVLDIRV
ncbi:MAG: hypothetical protein MUF14_08385 [Hyphomonadaceae bacterium]|jgi:hypothetical protein|nr:hypothetical protein [Hyphomonadaceae bacterium]